MDLMAFTLELTSPVLTDEEGRRLPARAEVVSLVSAEVSVPARLFNPDITPPTLELVMRLLEPLIRPDAKVFVYDWLASTREFAPLRTFPRLMRVLRLPRSRVPVVLRIL